MQTPAPFQEPFGFIPCISLFLVGKWLTHMLQVTSPTLFSIIRSTDILEIDSLATTYRANAVFSLSCVVHQPLGNHFHFGQCFFWKCMRGKCDCSAFILWLHSSVGPTPFEDRWPPRQVWWGKKVWSSHIWSLKNRYALSASGNLARRKTRSITEGEGFM